MRRQTEAYPLLMEHLDNHNDHEHVIDIVRDGDASLSDSSHGNPSLGLDLPQHEDRPSSSTHAPTSQSSSSSSNGLDSRNSSFIRRGDGYGRHHRSPLNSGLWISIELVVTVSQIIASIVVLSLSRHENPHAPLFAWVVGYSSGCVAILPLLYWRYRRCNSQALEQGPMQQRNGSQSNPNLEPTSYTTTSVNHAPEDEDDHTTVSAAWNGQNVGTQSVRFNVLVDHFKMALDCFFAVWFVIGNVWIFGGHSSSSDAPNLYRLCIVFLTFSCIGYAMPFILCATICCCLPCIISILGFREDLTQTRGATSESINSLPTYKFKLKKTQNRDGRETVNSEGVGEGGVLAAGTEKERVISGEDAVCCICLARYANNDELRELPCSHFFHRECVDKWLKINALCPLCKSDVGWRRQ
ncbi:PREDICTED: E3 ubiquitin-protein ligase At1g63170-like isoform X2 [Nelumbo nucifera]|uniref:E3 ubiquitin-protein ligase At1g63170-like isoform X2 n=1 Tax=Nelumbo nucifera TaxID=4432 RepID=A0A1U8Q298_NELNU|nr:PREDICTED: E3 ubiquitin-protein ligase At1g63170-like isoform X2 [Nelumbo nucifera]